MTSTRLAQINEACAFYSSLGDEFRQSLIDMTDEQFNAWWDKHMVEHPLVD